MTIFKIKTSPFPQKNHSLSIVPAKMSIFLCHPYKNIFGHLKKTATSESRLFESTHHSIGPSQRFYFSVWSIRVFDAWMSDIRFNASFFSVRLFSFMANRLALPVKKTFLIYMAVDRHFPPHFHPARLAHLTAVPFRVVRKNNLNSTQHSVGRRCQRKSLLSQWNSPFISVYSNIGTQSHPQEEVFWCDLQRKTFSDCDPIMMMHWS